MRLIEVLRRQHWLALLGFCVFLYVPYAGSYGMWDPWETHYGEIARQMLARHDWVSLWWPCSPNDRPEVFHKPVLHFWLMALSMKLFGLESAGARASELVDSWRVEWACRLPNIALSIAAIFAVYTTVRRLVGGRAATLTALILATSSQWLLVTRQAMTDMPFVVPMTIALAFVALALFDPMDAALARGEWRLRGRLIFSWPRTTSFYLLAGGFVLLTLPQLVVISLEVHMTVRLGAYTVRTIGLVPMLPYCVALVGGLWWAARAKNRRSLYLLNAYLMCALACLAKGPAGVALPGLVVIVYLSLVGRGREILRLEIPRGCVLLVAAAFPWYHAMLIRHGMAFWNEFIGDNYIHRAEGRHGDRGTFDYYLQWLSYGTFPWSGIALVGTIFSFQWLGGDSRKRGIAGFALAWIAVELTVMTVVNTKFHHYILPALPAVAILAGLLLDEVLAEPSRLHALALLLVAAPMTLLNARDLAALPARLLWLFCYDYVNMPGTGRPWPVGAEWAGRYQYQQPIWIFGLAATSAVVVLGVWAARGRAPKWGVRLFAAVAVAWALFVADRVLVELSPHWSQKQVIASYYAQRRGAEEPLVAWQLYWRGENFYTRNEIYRSPDPNERAVFLENSAKQAQSYLANHAGRRVFFIVERTKLEGLRQQLPYEARATLDVVDRSNNKLYLAVAQL